MGKLWNWFRDSQKRKPHRKQQLAHSTARYPADLGIDPTQISNKTRMQAANLLLDAASKQIGLRKHAKQVGSSDKVLNLALAAYAIIPYSEDTFADYTQAAELLQSGAPL